jgi:hypothetical protein
LSVPVYAEEPSRFDVVLDGGWSAPQSTYWRGALNLEGGVGYHLTHWFALQALGSYERFPADEEAWNRQLGAGYSTTVEGGQFTSLGLSAELKISLAGDPKNVVPYAVFGGSVSHVQEAASTVSVSYGGEDVNQETTTAFTGTHSTVALGGGVDVPAGRRVRVFVEARYRMFLRETGRKRMEYLGLRVGARIGL